jgi:hypothetical protein
MKFESVKCDECQRIQDGANHWMKIYVWPMNVGATVGMGFLPDQLVLHNTQPPIEPEAHDLCGQGCAVKHLAKLLKWNVPTEAE